jgi:hypothetical protein
MPLRTVLSVAVRFLLLSIQAGTAVGLLCVILMCIGGCGGYAEAIYGVGFGVFAAVSAFIALVIHYADTRKSNPQVLAKQAQLQWAWLGVTGLLLAVVFL